MKKRKKSRLPAWQEFLKNEPEFVRCLSCGSWRKIEPGEDVTGKACRKCGQSASLTRKR